MNKDKDAFFNRFKNGHEEIVVVAKNTAIPTELRIGDLPVRKLNDTQVSITGWRHREEAEIYFANHFKNGTEKLIGIKWAALSAYLDLYGGNKRKFTVLDLV